MISANDKISFGALLALLALVAASPARADNTPTFYRDPATSCSVGTFVPEEGLSVRWRGPCANSMAEGSGTAEWVKDGIVMSRWEGPYRLGLREGQFVITHPDGSKVTVDYHNGLPVLVFYVDPASHCSVGTYSPELGLSVHWSGACVASKADGAGVAEWHVKGAVERSVEGEFRAGLPEGRAVSTVADSGRTVRWEAEFRAGRMEGRCVVTSTEARIDGKCVDDKLNGSAIATFDNGGRYDGEFHDGHLSGRGVMTFPNGSHYEGDFVDGVLNGPGREVFPKEHESYEGNVLNGKYEGTGTYRFADGGVYEGEWHNGIPNGRGVYHGIPNGPFGMRRDFAGTWVNGCFSQPPLSAALFKKRAACGFDD